MFSYILSGIQHLDRIAWPDAIEILFFSICIYYFSLWLKKDRQHNLLPTFYGYCGLTCFAYTAQLYTMATFLYICAPISLILYLILHQDTLQRNFISMQSVEIKQADSDEWIDILARATLRSLNKNKDLICVIQHKQSLSTFIESPFTIDTPLQLELLEMLLTSSSYDSTKFILCTSAGNLRAVNAEWKYKKTDIQFAPEVAESDAWLQDALLFTTKNDAIIYKAYEATRTCDLIMQGKALHQNTPAATFALIKKYLHSTPNYKGNKNHVDQSKKNNFQQLQH